MARSPGRPFSLGRVLADAIPTAFSGAGVFFVMTLIIHVPIIAFTVWLATRMALATVVQDAQIHLFATAGASLFLQPLANAAVSYGVLMRLRGKPVGFGSCMRVGFSRLLPVLGAALLAGLAIGAASLLLVVPGIVLAMRFYVVTPVAAVEGVGGTAALRRSAELTRGNRWSMFALFLIAIVFNVTVTAVLQKIIVGATPTAESLGRHMIASTVLTALLEAINAVLVAVAYRDLRVALEGVDTDEIASVFD